MSAPHSTYKFECICGHTVTLDGTTMGNCPECTRPFEIRWKPDFWYEIVIHSESQYQAIKKEHARVTASLRDYEIKMEKIQRGQGTHSI